MPQADALLDRYATRGHRKARMNRHPFLESLERRAVVLDGAMGTSVHALDLPLAEYRDCENCTEILTLTRPDLIAAIHRSFLEVGCDAVETNTFGANRIVLSEFDLAPQAYRLNVSAAEIAVDVARKFSTADRPRFVAGSIGPGTRLVTLRQVDYDTLLESYNEQARGLLDGGVDIIVIETCQDILQAKTAVHAVRKAFDECKRRVPLVVQVTMETTGTMLVGTDIAAALTTLEAFAEVDVIGLNCATGPQEMSEHVRHLSRYSSKPISVMPNAGLPQLVAGHAQFPLTPEEMARWLREFVEKDGVRLVGGCCGTTPEHLAAVVEALRDVQPAPRQPAGEPAISSLYQSVSSRQDNSFLIVGERCNTNGSRKFKRLLSEGDIEALVETAVEQVREGSHVLDVCVDYVGRDGVADMHKVIDRFARDVTAPLMLDSTEAPVIEAGLKLAPGKCIVNSVNLEEGEKKLDTICPMLRQYGAAVVALTIDEDPAEAMAKTVDRKLSIATRLHELLTVKHGIREEDIFFDLLTFPITTGNRDDRRLALETLDGIEQVSKRLPRCQYILGVSNVSFGLAPAARAVLNSAFLHEARQRGLSAAIVHASKILPRNRISDERWNAALDLIYDRGSDGEALEKYIGLFEDGEKLADKVEIAALPIEQRLTRRIVDGAKLGLEGDLDHALQSYSPLEIVNRFLLDGMKEVGELFGSGQMQLPFVLKSAEAMKAAVAHLEPHMDKVAGASRGKVVLATVRGDVHDIGKNLVDIILSNNGYTVFNLGIKQPINAIIAAFREHDADAIGLSGLLVKSTLVMRDDLGVLNEQGIEAPVILGGAALTRRYVEADLRAIYRGPLFYAKDAFEGLELMGKIADGAALAAAPPLESGESIDAAALIEQRSAETLREEIEQRFGVREVQSETAAGSAARESDASQTATLARSQLRREHDVATPPFWGSRVIERIELKAALGYLNETMLFQVQWGFRKKGRSPADWKRYVDLEIRPHLRTLVERCTREEILAPQAVYGYWPCNSDGDELVVFEPPENGSPRAHEHAPELLRFQFPRQKKAPFRCVADYWRPIDQGEPDVFAVQIVTAGRRVSEVAREWFAANDYQQYLFLHGLGVETAEALAEYVHKQIRAELGVSQHDARDRQALFKQGYQGSRFSFGYPACPDLEQQRGIMKLLEPSRIGLSLSEEFQLEPEQSTSAIVTIHPEARYFSAR